MIIHKFVPAAADLRLCAHRFAEGEGAVCSQTAAASQHLRTPQIHFAMPAISVRVADPQYLIHVANVHWTRADNRSWFAAWVSPHHKPQHTVRLPDLDCWTLDEVHVFLDRLVQGYYNIIDLADLGIVSS